MGRAEETRGECDGPWSGLGRRYCQFPPSSQLMQEARCNAITLSFQDEKETVRPGANEEGDESNPHEKSPRPDPHEESPRPDPNEETRGTQTDTDEEGLGSDQDEEGTGPDQDEEAGHDQDEEAEPNQDEKARRERSGGGCGRNVTRG